jgi:hypothetical protein
VIDSREEQCQNAIDSMPDHSESVPNEIDESDLHDEKHAEQEIGRNDELTLMCSAYLETHKGRFG